MKKLIEILKQLQSVIVGFSGGSDSALLMYAIKKSGIRAKAVTFSSCFYSASEIEDAKMLAKELGIPHQVIAWEPFDNPALKSNPTNRCYICKRYLFSILVGMAKKEGFSAVIDGSNTDDLMHYRPGYKALEELGVKSPLVEAGFDKNQVREALRGAGYKSWNKPSFSCYFSRFPYGMQINAELLHKIAECEENIHALGFSTVRVRSHGDIARIEAEEDDFNKCVADSSVREKIISIVKKAGFAYITLDLEGYCTGSMDKELVVR